MAIDTRRPARPTVRPDEGCGGVEGLCPAASQVSDPADTALAPKSKAGPLRYGLAANRNDAEFRALQDRLDLMNRS